jgi:hypothetical protein
MLERANDVLERADMLDGAVSNLQAFRSLLEELNAGSPVALPRQQVQAVEMVRAAILRSAISLVVATLDRGDRRGNRASLGEIVRQLEDEPFAEFLLTTLRRGRGAKPDSENCAICATGTVRSWTGRLSSGCEIYGIMRLRIFSFRRNRRRPSNTRIFLHWLTRSNGK